MTSAIALALSAIAVFAAMCAVGAALRARREVDDLLGTLRSYGWVLDTDLPDPAAPETLLPRPGAR